MKSLNAKYFYLLLLSAVLVFSLVACGAPAEEAPAAEAPAADAPAAEAPAADAPAADAPAADVVAQFTFTNTGTVEICELYLSPVDKQEWGPDQLNQKTIPAGEKFTLTDIPAGKYDAKAVGCNGAGEQVIQLDIKN
jgi:uncharacterized protein involved in high-affinity Fe2+ transport